MEEPIAEVMILEVGVDMVGQVVRVMGDMEVLVVELVVVTGVGVAMRPALEVAMEVAVELPFMVVVEEDMVVLVVVDIILMGGRKPCILGPKNPYSQVRSWLLFSVSFISSPRCS